MAMTTAEFNKKVLAKVLADSYKEPAEPPVKTFTPQNIAETIHALDSIRKQKRKEEHTRNVGAFMGVPRKLFSK